MCGYRDITCRLAEVGLDGPLGKDTFGGVEFWKQECSWVWSQTTKTESDGRDRGCSLNASPTGMNAAEVKCSLSRAQTRV